MGASAPPMKPPKFCTAPTEATPPGGAAVIAIAQIAAPARLEQNSATDIAAMAPVLLGARIARPVKAAPAARPATMGSLRLSIGERRLARRSQTKPPVRLPSTPNR